jgi:hypothetical protein
VEETLTLVPAPGAPARGLTATQRAMRAARARLPRDRAAKTFGVSPREVDYAAAVLARGVPELIACVEEGRMALSTAAVLAQQPPEAQLAEVNKPGRHRRYAAAHNRNFDAHPAPGPRPDPDSNPGDRVPRGKGVDLAHEAINCLKRIPKGDALRGRAFQIVTDWIRLHQ